MDHMLLRILWLFPFTLVTDYGSAIRLGVTGCACAWIQWPRLLHRSYCYRCGLLLGGLPNPVPWSFEAAFTSCIQTPRETLLPISWMRLCHGPCGVQDSLGFSGLESSPVHPSLRTPTQCCLRPMLRLTRTRFHHLSPFVYTIAKPIFVVSGLPFILAVWMVYSAL